MKIEKNMFAGTGQVYRFTLRQLIGSRMNVISMIIMMVLALFALPVMTFLSGSGFLDDGALEASAIYLQNDTAYELDVEDVRATGEAFSDVTFVTPAYPVEEVADRLGEDELFVHIYKDTEAGMFSIEVFSQPDSELYESSAVDGLTAAITDGFQKAQYRALGATPEQLAIATAQVEMEAEYASDYLASDQIPWDVQYFIQIFYAVVVMMVSVLTVSYIVRSVTEEKTSKLVEVLMVSLRPLALLTGKILAVMTYILFQMVVYVGCFILSYKVSSRFMDMSGIDSVLAQNGISMEMFHMGPALAAVVLLSLLLAYMTYALVAGLMGAGCSKTEDVQSAVQVPTMICMAAYMVSCVTSPLNSPTVALVTSLVPFVSGFCAPVHYLLGDIGMGVMVLSWLIQMVVIAGLMFFATKVYRDLIIHKGERVRILDMIRMAAASRQQKGA